MKEINSLRLSVTQRCNLSCPYCHREGELNPAKEISMEKIEEIIKNAKSIGIKKIKITGGEPLVREDIADVVGIIKKYNFEELSLVTNGFLLDKYAFELKEAGLNRVNIGCDSLSSNILLKNVENIKSGLRAAKEAGLTPIKLNMVVLKGINDKEIVKMIEFARENDAVLQLIELINIDDEFYKKHYFSLKEIEKELEKKAMMVIKKDMHNRRQYDLGDVMIEIVRPFTKDFCQNCTRLRITSDGRIKPCLMRNDNLIDFKDKCSLIEAIKEKGVLYVRNR